MTDVRLTPERSRRPQETTFTEPCLILVEGSGDQVLLSALIKSEDLDGFQVHDMGGKSDWVRKVGAVPLEPTFRANVRAIGLVRDADADARRAWQSCGDALERAGLPVPTQHLVPAHDGMLAAAVAIVPSMDATGAIEDLCLSALDEQALACTNAYLRCVSDGRHGPRPTAKAKLHAYLAGHPRAPGSLNVAIRQRVFDLSHSTFDGLRQFVRALHAVAVTADPPDAAA